MILQFFNLRTVPTKNEVFCAVYDLAGKVDLSKGYWNPKTKIGVTMHFLEIIKQQEFQKAAKYKTLYGIFFPN